MTDTFTDTYNRDDIRRVHASFAADYKIVAEWTELHDRAFVAKTVEQIKALATEQYLSQVHLHLKSSTGVIREAAVYRVSANASSWSSDRPGDLYWDVQKGDGLYIIVYFSQKWLDLSPLKKQAFAAIHMPDWGTSDFDGNYGTMTQRVDRRYASRAYGLERTRYTA
jgi:hypothetical protein